MKAVHIAFKARQRAIEDSKRATVEAKFQKQKAATQHSLMLQQQYTANIIHYGLWQTVDLPGKKSVLNKNMDQKKVSPKK